MIRAVIRQHGRFCELRPIAAIKTAKYGGGKRGKVQGFSPQSRRRLLKLFASLAREFLDSAVFCTLTYGQEFPDAKEAKAHFRAFVERVKRYHPKACAIWKMEYQDRGAPHFHILLFNARKSVAQKWVYSKEWIQSNWADVIGKEYWDNVSGREPFTRIEAVKSYRKTMSYICKYIAKVDKGNHPQPPQGASGDSLGSTTTHICTQTFSGRCWGYVNQRLFIKSAIRSIRVKLDCTWEEATAILRFIRRIVRFRGMAVTFFTEDIDYFLEYWQAECGAVNMDDSVRDDIVDGFNRVLSA